MADLIEALQIFLKYGNPYAPTHCEHDVLLIMVSAESVTDPDDQKRLEELGFFISDEYGDGYYQSYRFGSA